MIKVKIRATAAAGGAESGAYCVGCSGKFASGIAGAAQVLAGVVLLIEL